MLKITSFWEIVSLVIALIIEAVCTSEMPTYFYKTWHYIPEGCLSSSYLQL
jgi:uncharacterized membrane protein SpoIIM required for sporulation